MALTQTLPFRPHEQFRFVEPVPLADIADEHVALPAFAGERFGIEGRDHGRGVAFGDAGGASGGGGSEGAGGRRCI